MITTLLTTLLVCNADASTEICIRIHMDNSASTGANICVEFLMLILKLFLTWVILLGLTGISLVVLMVVLISVLVSVYTVYYCYVFLVVLAL